VLNLARKEGCGATLDSSGWLEYSSGWWHHLHVFPWEVAGPIREEGGGAVGSMSCRIAAIKLCDFSNLTHLGFHVIH